MFTCLLTIWNHWRLLDVITKTVLKLLVSARLCEHVKLPKRGRFCSWRGLFIFRRTVEPHRQKTYLRTCAPSDDSVQPAHSDQNFHWAHAKFIHAHNEDSDQAARTRRLICVFVGRTCPKVPLSHDSAQFYYYDKHESSGRSELMEQKTTDIIECFFIGALCSRSISSLHNNFGRD